MKAILPWTLFTAIIIFIVATVKPATIFLAESYTSLILENNVTITSLHFIDANLSLHVGNKKNTLTIQVINYSPLLLDARYVGDINAFKKYHPLNGFTNIYAKVSYDKKLQIKAKSDVYNSNTQVNVDLDDSGYKVSAKIKNADLKKFQKENNKNLKLSGRLNGDLTLQNNKFNISSTLNLPYLEKTTINAIGSFDEDSLHVEASAKTKDDEIKLNNILYKDEKLSLNTSYLGTPLYLSLQDNRLTYVSEDVSTAKVFKLLHQEEILQGLISINGKTNLRNLQSKIVLNSKNIQVEGIDFKTLHVESVVDLDKMTFELSSLFKNKEFNISGEIIYADDLYVKIFNENFDARTSFETNGKTFKLKSKHLNLQKVQVGFELEELVAGDVDLEASGSFDDINFRVKSNEFTIKKYDEYFKNSIALDISGNYDTKSIKLSPRLNNENFNLYDGNITYNLDTKLLKISQHLLLKDTKLPIEIKTQTFVKAPYKSKGKIIHDNDYLIINDFKFLNKRIMSNFSLDVLNLSKYELFTKVKLVGPLHIEAKHDDGKTIAYTNTFDGRLSIEADDNFLAVYLNNINLKKLDNVLGLNKLFDAGNIDGVINYHKQNKEASTYIVGSNIILNGLDIDKELSTLEDVLGLNIIALGRNTYKGYKYSEHKSYIQKLQFTSSFIDQNLTLEDVAISTKKFRISADGNLQQNGKINKLDINILEQNGCALISQEIEGSIQKPKLMKKTGAVINLVSNMPSNVLKTGKKWINFATNIVDNVATFTLQSTHLKDEKVTITTDIKNGAGLLFTDTSDMVLSKGCKVVYDGRVKHPIQND